MLKINSTAKYVCRQLSPKEKINYNVQIHKPLQKQSRVHIEKQFESYEILLKSMLSKTNIKDFCHSSVLEKINHNIQDLPFYFAIFNSFLRKNIETWDRNHTFKNKNGTLSSATSLTLLTSFLILLNLRRFLFAEKEIIP